MGSEQQLQKNDSFQIDPQSFPPSQSVSLEHVAQNVGDL
jgi:hypothetical protein